MIEENIEFHYIDIETLNAFNVNKTREWIKKVIALHNKNIIHISYVFCSDKYLLKINQEYLQHDYLTDIITFDNSDKKNDIEADIFISIERVIDNAKSLNIEFYTELRRVIIHGVLHLLGFNDKSSQEEKIMRLKEDDAIMIYN